VADDTESSEVSSEGTKATTPPEDLDKLQQSAQQLQFLATLSVVFLSSWGGGEGGQRADAEQQQLQQQKITDDQVARLAQILGNLQRPPLDEANTQVCVCVSFRCLCLYVAR
jgi:hypothetical protein